MKLVIYRFTLRGKLMSSWSGSYIYIYFKECDLQLYEGVASSPNSKSQTEEESFEY